MREIVIVGAGQSGLQLALGLQARGYGVTVLTNRTGDDIARGRVMSSQCMFGTALAHERALGLDFWAADCPDVEGISFTVPAPDGSGKAIDWAARLDRPAQAVDQRVKIPRWLAEFERRGGRVELVEAGIGDLERHAARADLVVVAAGKGEIAQMFARNDADSTFAQPMRALALTYVTGMTPRPGHSAVCFNLCPGVGEYFVFPALTTTGPCEIMVFEGIPGGPMDCWGDVKTPAEHLERSTAILRQFFPWEADRCRRVELTDGNGILAGRFAPTVRHPVAALPSGKAVLGMADVVVLNDPITGQGSNNAAKCAAAYLDAIVAHGDRPFDAVFMRSTFDRYWAYARHVARWTNALLMPPPPHVLMLLGMANTLQPIADRFVAGFDDPRDFADWFFEPDRAEGYVAGLAAAA